ncbi:MAG TPA: cobyrinate a,c-diamide synthase, partial [Nitrososphaera sp.]|nr:cobyrinate a,c-diamide synthase [Nitrososphaera sp.]
SYHTFVTRRQSRNLDVWMMGKRGVIECFASACQGADIAVVEGVMGLFDGMSGKSNFASTAHVAKILDAPIILVVDASKSARSAAAIALGFLHFDKGLKIAGIILNNVASDRHESHIVDAFASKIRVPVLGIIRRNTQIKMEERHLGLIPTYEMQETKRKALVAAAKSVADQIDIDKILSICGIGVLPDAPVRRKLSSKARIAVALDESFNFYYADNLDALRMSGAELVFFSPVHDNRLPEGINGLIIGGGFPEVLADRLERNGSMIKSIRNAVQDGIPVYGECGGLMYLTRSIRGYMGEKRVRKMTGLIDADTLMTKKITLNYTEAQCNGPLFGRAHLRGHEFHYSSIEGLARDVRFSYIMKKGNGITGEKDGVVVNENGLAAYMHLHFANNKLAYKLVQACAAYSHR